MNEVAQRFVEALAAKDYKGIFAALATDARFCYLVPRGPAELVGAADVAAKYFQWFGDADVLEVKSIRVEPIADRTSARYRFLLHKPEGWKEIEQQSYLDLNQEGGSAASISCAPVSAPRKERRRRKWPAHIALTRGISDVPTAWPRSSVGALARSLWATYWW